MTWRYGQTSVTHQLPLGVTTRAAVGDLVQAGDELATGTRSGPPLRVGGAGSLGLSSDECVEARRVEVGAEVRRGAVLARTGRRLARAAVAPIDGRVLHRTGSGDLIIAPVTGRWAVRSAMEGTVVRTDDGAITVDGNAWTLGGIAAYGPDAIGELYVGVDAPMDELAPARIDVRLRDRIVVCGTRVAAEAITRAHACGVSGLVAGGVPAAGLRVVYGADVGAHGRSAEDDRPTVLCLLGFGSASLPLAVHRGLVALSGSPAAIHTASGRLIVFAPADAIVDLADAPELILAADFGAVRPLDGTSVFAGPLRFPSEVEADAIDTGDGLVPAANILPLDAPR
ncbi:MAG: hypothetical protein NVSMB8_04750 [Candidatus Limnocylindrales bacterium]